MTKLRNKTEIITRPITTTTTIILITFVLIIVCFTGLKEYSSVREDEDKVILNIYGKQRMYTQAISKDSERIYSGLLANSIEHEDKYIKDNQERIKENKDSLISSKLAFSEIVKATQNGYINWESYVIDINGFISESRYLVYEIDSLWSRFEDAIDIIVEANEINSEVTEAAFFISEHNLELLDLSEQLQKIILDMSIKSSNKIEIIFCILILLLSAVTLKALFHLARFAILPFNQIYKGLSEIGLYEMPARKGFSTRKKVMPLLNEVNEMFYKIEDLISLIQNINTNSSFTEILDFINKTFSSIIPYNYIGVALLNDDKTMLKASYGVSDGKVVGMPENLHGVSFNINETSLGKLIQTGEARIINDLESYTNNKSIKSYNKIILASGIKASITLPLKVSGKPIGIIFFSSINKNVYQEGHMKFLETLASSIAISFQQNTYIDNIIYSSVLALAKLAEARDTDTGQHLERMKTYSRIIAEILHEHDTYADEVTLEYVGNIERYSPLHDIGKVGIPDDILLKPEKLNEEEYELMKKHALYGAEVLKNAEDNLNAHGRSVFDMAIDITVGHHEKWDESGYPYGKGGLDIPLSARIVAISDVFDALTSRRPYKEPFSYEESISIIEQGKGKNFDPNIVELVILNQDKIRKAYDNFMK